MLKAEIHWIKGGREEGVLLDFEKTRRCPEGLGKDLENYLREKLMGLYQLDIKKNKIEIKLLIEGKAAERIRIGESWSLN